MPSVASVPAPSAASTTCVACRGADATGSVDPSRAATSSRPCSSPASTRPSSSISTPRTSSADVPSNGSVGRSPVVVSHTWIRPSLLAVANRLPLGSNSISQTSLRCAWKDGIASRPSASVHPVTSPAPFPARSSSPSGLNATVRASGWRSANREAVCDLAPRSQRWIEPSSEAVAAVPPSGATATLHTISPVSPSSVGAGTSAGSARSHSSTVPSSAPVTSRPTVGCEVHLLDGLRVTRARCRRGPPRSRATWRSSRPGCRSRRAARQGSRRSRSRRRPARRRPAARTACRRAPDSHPPAPIRASIEPACPRAAASRASAIAAPRIGVRRGRWPARRAPRRTAISPARGRRTRPPTPPPPRRRAPPGARRRCAAAAGSASPPPPPAPYARSEASRLAARNPSSARPERRRRAPRPSRAPPAAASPGRAGRGRGPAPPTRPPRRRPADGSADRPGPPRSSPRRRGQLRSSASWAISSESRSTVSSRASIISASNPPHDLGVVVPSPGAHGEAAPRVGRALPGRHEPQHETAAGVLLAPRRTPSRRARPPSVEMEPADATGLPVPGEGQRRLRPAAATSRPSRARRAGARRARSRRPRAPRRPGPPRGGAPPPPRAARSPCAARPGSSAPPAPGWR